MEKLNTITLITGDGSKVTTRKELLKRSILITETLNQDNDSSIIRLANIDILTLNDILAYLEHYEFYDPPSIPKPLPRYSIAQIVGVWDDNFISKYSKNIEHLIEFLDAAIYLNIPELIDLASAKAATLVKDYDKTKFIKTFNIVEDLCEEEAAVLREKLIAEKKQLNNNN